jgi:dinuclear metal center YbgI/SA1388 family protein
MMLRDLMHVFDSIARVHHAADWDNVGLLVGDPKSKIRTAMLCIDVTGPVLAESKKHRAQLVLAYHPPLFKPPTSLTPQSAPILWDALQAKLALYSMHTALDVARGGTNDVLAEIMGMTSAGPIEAAQGSEMVKVVVFAPAANVEAVIHSAFACGAGIIGNYSECSFRTEGEGTFYGSEATTPRVGQKGYHERIPEVRVELSCPMSRLEDVLGVIREVHPYEEPAIDVYPMITQPHSGMGRIGEFSKPVTEHALITRIKREIGVKHVLVARPQGREEQAEVRRAACAAGSCGEMWKGAVAAGATFYLTGEMKHHEALAAAQAGLTVVCVGHSHSERPVLSRLATRLGEEVPDVRWLVSEADRDPFEIL